MYLIIENIITIKICEKLFLSIKLSIAKQKTSDKHDL